MIQIHILVILGNNDSTKQSVGEPSSKKKEEKIHSNVVISEWVHTAKRNTYNCTRIVFTISRTKAEFTYSKKLNIADKEVYKPINLH